jgi:tetratricopeptide (TPR) repeat protein
MSSMPEELELAFQKAEALGRTGRWQEVRSTLLPFRAEIVAYPAASYLLAFAYVTLSDLVPGRKLAVESIEAARRANETEWEMKCANLLGILEFQSGKLELAERFFQAALALAESRGSDAVVGMVANNLGNISGLRGEMESAIEHYQTALGVYRRAGDRFREAQALYNLGIARRDLDQWDEAESHFVEAAQISQECKEPGLFASAVAERAGLRVRTGRLDEAERMARSALLRFDVQSDTSGLAEVYRILGIVARERLDFGNARRHFDKALEYCSLHENALITAEIRLERGLLVRQMGEDATAREELAVAASLFDSMHAVRQANIARGYLARAS